MDVNFFPRFALVLGLAFAGAAWSYDAPRFERPLCDRDALSIGPKELDEVVTALTALVSNFPEGPVDSDVKEKAIALALCLRPIDAGAREAHAALLAGRQPAEVAMFDSLGAISGSLWRHAEKLAAPGAEPEDRRLAPMLMEVALLIFPGTPPAERQLAFQKAAKESQPNWAQTLDLQPADNPSNARAIALFRPVEGFTPPVPPENPSTVVNNVPTPPVTPPVPLPLPGTPPTMPEGKPPSEVKLREGAIVFVAPDLASGEAIAGVASMKVREPDSIEQNLSNLFLGEPRPDAPLEMRLTYDPSGASISSVSVAEGLVRAKYPRWPDKLFAEFAFRPAVERQPPGRVNFSLPALALLGSAFSGEALSAAFAPGGDYALAGEISDLGAVSFPGQSVGGMTKALRAMTTPPRVLLIPLVAGDTAAEMALVAAATDGGDLAALLRPQVLGYSTLDDLKPAMTGAPQEALTGAIADFATVQALTDRMDIGAIARNDAVRKRLTDIVAKWPGHVSARALLAYGTRPVGAGMSLEGSLKAVDAALDPLRERYQAVQVGELSTAAAIATLADTANRALVQLRTKIDPQAKNYLDMGIKTTDAAKVFLSLNNPGTSIGQQRNRELLDRHTEMRSERARLGFPSELDRE